MWKNVGINYNIGLNKLDLPNVFVRVSSATIKTEIYIQYDIISFSHFLLTTTVKSQHKLLKITQFPFFW